MIADHVRSNVASTDAVAWLVDGFGNAHALAKQSSVGRAHDGQIVVLASSVSREHAELRAGDDGWVVRDLGSRNGTFVDGVRCQGRAVLPARAQLTIGDVAMWFLVEVRDEPEQAVAIETASAGGLVRFVVRLASGGELCVVGATDSATGGSLLVRASDTAAWRERGLAPLEFQLLRALCARAAAERDSPAAVRGCVPTKQLARDLPFQSKYANEENVRQVVRRLRQELAEAGADGALAVAPGRGYYLACDVTVGPASQT